MFQRCRSLCSVGLKVQTQIHLRCVSILSKAEVRKKRNKLFDQEKKRQRNAVGRIEKIEVKYQGPLDKAVLVMNKNLSTPHDCAKHISEGVTTISALALVDGIPWDMHRPLVSDCELKLINLKVPEVFDVNTAFWRTCSLILGAVIDTAFKDDIDVHLHSFPGALIKAGSFVHDAHLSLTDWKPTNAEMRAMSAQFVKLSMAELPVERLEVDQDLALEIFQDNPYKTKQIPNITQDSENEMVTLYRIGDHIDISKGPVVGNTRLIGRCTIASVHKIQLEDGEDLFRFQGVAIPKGILINHFAYGILEERARKLNTIRWISPKIIEQEEDNIAIAAKN